MKNTNLWIAAGLGAIALIAAAGALPAGDPQKETPREKSEKPVAEVKAALGKPAPDFELKDLDGKAVKLSDYKGKTVVLEWFNPECPFVVRAHGEGSLKDQATRVTKDGVVWLSINSGASGKQGAGLEENRKAKAAWKMANPILIDPKGDVGRRYEAKTTPHMYVIDAKGNLAYRGAIDNAPNGKPEDGAALVNYVDAALADLKAGKPVAKPETKSYGCSVKY
ncbi:MAG: thioredoxin family protein [Planctomycetota bacterium]|nr:thioredoxin family protein [Planctomycetota bacterium]